MNIDYKAILALGGVILVIGWVLRNQVGQAAAAVGQGIDPVNPNNWINTGFLRLYSTLTDGQGTLGTDIYDILNPGR